MKITLVNGVELNPIIVTGEHRYVQGADRDVLNFVFPVETSLDELDNLFTSTNCEKIIITETDENGVEQQYIYNAYTVRAELKRTPIEVTPATDSEPEVIENRVTVSMGQRTYQESQYTTITNTVDAMLGVNE